jgi:hypothetical protein
VISSLGRYQKFRRGSEVEFLDLFIMEYNSIQKSKEILQKGGELGFYKYNPNSYVSVKF